MKRQGSGVREQGSEILAARLCSLLQATILLALTAVCVMQSAAQQRPAYLPQGYKVAGTVVNTVTGEPVRGATVKLMPQQESTALGMAHTDGEGRFEIAGVSAGKYQLQAARRGYPAALYEQHGSFNSAIVTGPDQDTGHLVFRLAPAAVLHGVVTADGGEPVENARVELFRKPGVETPESRIYQQDKTTTDDQGEYEFDNLEAGEYLLAVVAAPWYSLNMEPKAGQPQSELDVAFPVTYYDSTTDERSALPIRLERGNRAEANIGLHTVPAIHLAISAPGKAGEDPSATLRQSIFGNTEEADTAQPNLHNLFGPTTSFALAPGHYELSAGSPPRVMGVDATSSDSVDVATGAPAGKIKGTLESAPGVPFDKFALVTLVPADGGSGQHELQCTAVKGQFDLDNVPAGTWTVTLTNGYGYAMQIHAIEIDKRPHTGNQLALNGQTLTVTILASDGAGTIQGFARHEGKGVPGAMIVLVPQDLKQIPLLARRDQSDSDGSFSLSGVFPGTYTVVALENAWELDWSQPETIVRYLPGGVSVTVSRGASGVLRLEQAVAVQPR